MKYILSGQLYVSHMLIKTSVTLPDSWLQSDSLISSTGFIHSYSWHAQVTIFATKACSGCMKP